MRDDWQAIILLLMFMAAMILISMGLFKVYAGVDPWAPPTLDPDLQADEDIQEAELDRKV